jgi:hypothetical protein
VTCETLVSSVVEQGVSVQSALVRSTKAAGNCPVPNRGLHAGIASPGGPRCWAQRDCPLARPLQYTTFGALGPNLSLRSEVFAGTINIATQHWFERIWITA